MKKVICDACGRDGANCQFEYDCHLDDLAAGKPAAYSDSEGNSVSGRTVTVDLCNACYNNIVVLAVSALKIRMKGKRGNHEVR